MKTLFYMLIFLTSIVSMGCGDKQKEITFKVDKKYLLVPIDNSAPDVPVFLEVENEIVSPRMNIRIAEKEVKYWMPIEVEIYKGKTIRLVFNEENKKEGVGYSQIKLSDSFDFEYNEKYRPKYHFSPQYGWINDPNGMVYDNGEYHLYFQHNPYGTNWGNMHWGHTVSKDLKKWEYLPVAIAPDTLGTIFSGSAVIDKDNTAGFGHNALISIYTADGKSQTQCIAYSLDKGRTFTKYKANPVLTDPNYRDFRDPKVFWHDQSNQWVMSLATSQVITFYGSKNLKEWTKLSDFGNGIGNHDGVWECPDLFQVSYDGQSKWVLIVSINPGGPNGGSASQYFIGQFDGKEFIADKLPYPLWLDYGRDNYAGVTWSNTPSNNPIFIGWMSNWDYANNVPTTYFANTMTVPREISIVNNGKHLVVASNPVAELKNLRGETITLPSVDVSDVHSFENLFDKSSGAYEIEIEIEANKTEQFLFKLANKENEELLFGFDIAGEKMWVDRSKSGNIDFNEKFAKNISIAPLVKKANYKIKLLIDHASSELFVNDGEIVQTNIIFPSMPYNKLTIENNKGSIKVKNINLYQLK